MTKAELISEIAIATGYDKATIGVIVETMMTCVKRNVVDGNYVYLRGFGSFITKTRAAKMARNISKNITVPVEEHRVAYFKPAAEFQQEVRQKKAKKTH